jgi:hypothetical protein
VQHEIIVKEKFDRPVKNPFFRQLRIWGFRNCELLSAVSPKGIARNAELFDVLRDHHYQNVEKINITSTSTMSKRIEITLIPFALPLYSITYEITGDIP